MVGCYAGFILHIDLSNRTFKKVSIESSIYKLFIGGKGLGIKLLMDLTDPGIEALSPQNPLIFVSGPMEGIAFPAANRIGVIFKSPLTGFYGEAYAGGFIGVEVKKAGYDAIVITGRSNNPIYLDIFDDNIEFRNASHLWGKTTFECENILKSDHKGSQVLCIGPAGENLVKYSCISHDAGRQLGRCGCGTVMGSKNLKAIVVKGSHRFEEVNSELLNSIKMEIIEKTKKTHQGMMKYGTPAISILTNTTGSLPSMYWVDGAIEWFENIGPDVLLKHYYKSSTCYACHIACRKHSRIDGFDVEGPEYETWFALGSLCGVKDPKLIVKANYLCDALGLDTISTGNIVAFTMHLREKGILKDIEVNISYSNPEDMLKLIEMIAYRKGFGNILAEGVRKASEIIGENAVYEAIHVKGLEPPAYDPRALKAVALAYAISCRGACHLRHIAHRPNLTGQHPFKSEVKVDRLSYSGQAEIVKELEDFYAVIDSMILCKFHALPGIGPILWSELTKLYSAVTGIDVSISYMVEVGERINNLVRLYNIREGLKTEDDNLPERMFKEPLRYGASKGETVNRDQFIKMRNEYYNIRGWIDGKPSVDTLKRLKLDNYIKASYSR
ncbi:MAG: aldehyde ferredoxin oxidoreductase family protein [Candidatus Methanomethylicia archaeon]